ncbi:4'-phosphopantetheinyl transferase [Bisgaardia hudsonensis]|uniref:4'-phosphopantetheinyl transferase n=1 Tax=Bisgaardia hudsonensis TaxID=109472 RepID=A0A4R2N2C7_9PAST|nr:4'-phosphopantetheinyl transferase superfamily protein [Bisgaardia hudsonensis]QLB12432.1 hypothetical protein A6A11_01810 [Bisgaardia hudsonensis]TCP13965.1 4'-phosphopantetheinyl transferase [Bisgaardia hudsonensis]
MTVLVAWGNIQDEYPLHLIPQELLTEKLLFLPNDSFRAKQKYQCRWVAHFLLWELFKKAEINTALLSQIFLTEKERPRLPIAHIDFNISHSDNWVAVVLQIKDKKQKSAVGIDIEYPKKSRKFTALLTQFASAKEKEWFNQQQNVNDAFYRIWCLREAILKSQGVGIAKLSEVQHYPDKFLINSEHCPEGELIFTTELPFYLAIFAKDNCENLQFFNWCKGTLSEIKLFKKIKYLVNNQSGTLKAKNCPQIN